MIRKQGEESFKVDGEELLKKVKELISEGNVRRITIKNKDGKTLVGETRSSSFADAHCRR